MARPPKDICATDFRVSPRKNLRKNRWCPSTAWMKGRRSEVDRSLVEPGVKVTWHAIAQQCFHSPHRVRHTCCHAMPGVTAATAWAIQHADFAEALETNYLLPGPTSREGISALRHTYCRTPSPDDRAKRRTPCVFIHAIEGHHPRARDVRKETTRN